MAVHHSVVQCRAEQFNVVECSIMQISYVLYSAVQCRAVQSMSVRHRRTYIVNFTSLR